MSVKTNRVVKLVCWIIAVFILFWVAIMLMTATGVYPQHSVSASAKKNQVAEIAVPINVVNRDGIEYWKIDTYISKYVSEEYKMLEKNFMEENRLKETKSYVRYLKAFKGKYLFRHKIVAFEEELKENEKQDCKQYIYYCTDLGEDIAEEYAHNVEAELGYKLISKSKSNLGGEEFWMLTFKK